MKSTLPSSLRYGAALLLLCVLHAIYLYRWTQKDTVPLAWDQAIHTKIAYEYRDRMGGASQEPLFAPVDMNYPPLYHLFLMPALTCVKDIADAGAFINFFFLCFLLVSVFLIGRFLLGPPAGLTAAVLVGFYPVLIDLSRNTLIDLSLTSWVAFAFYCLLKSRSFSDARWSAAFGLALGCGMLTKWTAAAYLFFPACAAGLVALTHKRVGSVALALAVAAVVMAPWYGPNIVPSLIRIGKLSSLPPASQKNMSGLANLFWYPLSWSDQLNGLFLLLLIPGLILCWRKKDLWPVLLYFFGTTILFTLITNRNVRYFAPALPAAAVLTAAWLPEGRRWIHGAVIAASLIFFLSIQYVGGVHKSWRMGSQPIWLYNSRLPDGSDWNHRRLFDEIKKASAHPEGPNQVLVLCNHAYFHGASFRMSMRSQRVSGIFFHGPSKQRSFEFADFVLTKTGDIGPAFTLGTINKCLSVVNDPNGWFPSVFKEAARWPLPDGTEAVLYQARIEPQRAIDIGLFNIRLGEMELPRIRLKNVELNAVPLSKRDTGLGRLKELSIACDELVYNKVPFTNVAVRLTEPHVNVPLFLETQQIELLRLKELKPKATIRSDFLLAMLAEKAKWLTNPALEFAGSSIKISGNASGVPIEAVVDALADGSALRTRIRRLRIFRVPVPLFLVRNLTDHDVSLKVGEDLAYDLKIDRISGNGNELQLNP